MTDITRIEKFPPQIALGQTVDGKEIAERIGRKLTPLLVQEAGMEGLYGLGDVGFVQVLLAAAAAPLACMLKVHVMGVDHASLAETSKLGMTTVRALLTQFKDIENYAKPEHLGHGG